MPEPTEARLLGKIPYSVGSRGEDAGAESRGGGRVRGCILDLR